MTLPGNGNVQHEACKPVLRQSVPFCFKALDLFFLFSLVNLHNTSLLAPSSLYKARSRNEGCSPSWARWLHFCKWRQQHSTGGGCFFLSFFFFCLDAKETTQMSCFLTDILSLPCDSHWQGSLCHTLGCNGTNAARDTVYCAFLPAHWTLATQLCKTCPIDATDTTASFAL